MRRHPWLAARLQDGDIEAAHLCNRETLTASRRYTISISEEDAATLLGVGGEAGE